MDVNLGIGGDHHPAPANDPLDRGACLIIFNSDDMKDGALEFARAHPDIPIIHISGEPQRLAEGPTLARLPNLANVMAMEHGARHGRIRTAAMTTRTGRIGYLGPPDQPDRRAAGRNLPGARHAWTQVLKGAIRTVLLQGVGSASGSTYLASPPIPPRWRTDFSPAVDVIVSGIDTTEALAEARKLPPGQTRGPSLRST